MLDRALWLFLPLMSACVFNILEIIGDLGKRRDNDKGIWDFYL